MITWFDEKHNCNVTYLSLPHGVNEALTLNDDGSFTVFISTQISQEKQEAAYKHALWHITNDDFYKPDVQEIETEAHRTDNRHTDL